MRAPAAPWLRLRLLRLTRDPSATLVALSTQAWRALVGRAGRQLRPALLPALENEPPPRPLTGVALSVERVDRKSPCEFVLAVSVNSV